LGADGVVDFGDLNFIIAEAAPAFSIMPTPEHLLCADVANTLQTPGPDGKIDFGDINY